jgi:hypothetical protein
MKKYTFGGQKGKNRPSEPKHGIWGPKSVWSCDISIEREFYMQQKNILWRVNKTKICLYGPKKEFGAKNQYGRVTNPSIGNFTWSKKKCTTQG